MNLEPVPRLNKTPFVLTAAGCLTVVILIGLFAPNKFAPVYVLTAVGFLIASITAIMFPVLSEYTADHDEYVQQERERVNEQIQRLHAAGESLARAAAQIKAVEEAVHKTAHAAENLPYRMQEKLAEFNAALAEKEEANQEALEQELTELRAANSEKLQAAAEKISKATAEWTALEAATRKQLKAAQDIATQLEEKLKGALARLEAAPVSAPRTASEPVEEKKAEPAAVVESVSVSETPAPAAEEPKPKKPRAPRKPRPEDTLAAMSESSEPGAGSSGESPAPEAASEPAPSEPSVSIDGATRLLVTAYIGIGNKLYIRGDGPGLSEDKGVPMHFVSIGKWGWSTDDAKAPIACKLYKNDETVAVSGEIFLEPGQHVEVTALF